MASTPPIETDDGTIPVSVRQFFRNRMFELGAISLFTLILAVVVALSTWSVLDPSWNNAIGTKPTNLLGFPGAVISDQLIQYFGLAVLALVAAPLAWSSKLLFHQPVNQPLKSIGFWLLSVIAFSICVSTLPSPNSWPLGTGLGGSIGSSLADMIISLAGYFTGKMIASIAIFILFLALSIFAGFKAVGINRQSLVFAGVGFNNYLSALTASSIGWISHLIIRMQMRSARKKQMQAQPDIHEDTVAEATDHPVKQSKTGKRRSFITSLTASMPSLETPLDPVSTDINERIEPQFASQLTDDEPAFEPFDDTPDYDSATIEPASEPVVSNRISAPAKPIRQSKKLQKDKQPSLPLSDSQAYEFPPLTLLSEPAPKTRSALQTADALEQNARMLEGVLEDFGVRGEIINVRPGPVVTLYELEPAPGIKSSRVIGLADDIARSMSAISARVAVVPGRNVIGIELPNSDRETVYLRELVASQTFEKSKQHLAVALGKDISGEPVLADLARMPHLLIAGTTGSGKSVGINTMILSLLYRMSPEDCKLIMIDPKMLELSIYEGIPHLLSPVVTDPKKAVVALKWAVKEMEERYHKMSKMGVRNVDGFNKRARQALKDGTQINRTVQTGYDPETREPIFEEEPLDLTPLPFIVVIIDEMADLMMVAGKEIEGTVQRLAQMARAAGIHVIMATQRPSVDVITGTIKANFPTRISFQVTSKIDSRTILGEQGAENLLGQGDMLYMAGGGRITRLHGAFASDKEVESIVEFLKAQGTPEYIDAVTEEPADSPYTIPGLDIPEQNSGDELYDKAVAIILRDKKVSTSYIQRRLSIGYNKAATIIERMEENGVISAPSTTGKREILAPDHESVIETYN